MFGFSTGRHRIVSALKELIGGGITEMLPTIRNTSSEHVLDDIGRSVTVAARQFSGHTITRVSSASKSFLFKLHSFLCTRFLAVVHAVIVFLLTITMI